MPFPTIDDILIKLLKIIKIEKKYNIERAIRYFNREYKLNTSELDLTHNSTKIHRELVYIGRDILICAGLIEGTNKSLKVSKFGLEFLKTKPEKLNLDIIKKKFPTFIENWKDFENYFKENYPKIEIKISKFYQNQPISKITSKQFITKSNNQNEVILSPEDEIEKIFNTYNQKFKDDLLTKIKNMSPPNFEELSVDIVFSLCYHKEFNINKSEVTKTLGKTGDGGIDGIIIKKDKIKETKIYVQSKCWKNNQVSRPEIHKFIGALVGQKSRDGIFITTSTFAKTAIDFAKEQNGFDIKLIDGSELVDLMIEYEIGVQLLGKYRLNSIDNEYFQFKKLNKTTKKF